MLIKCLHCEKIKNLEEVEQVIVRVVGDKNLHYCFCCKKCLKDLSKGDWLVKDKVSLIKEMGFISEETLKNMISHYLLSDYHYRLFSGWKK